MEKLWPDFTLHTGSIASGDAALFFLCRRMPKVPPAGTVQQLSQDPEPQGNLDRREVGKYVSSQAVFPVTHCYKTPEINGTVFLKLPEKA